jgi:phenylacetate-CoA ligase
MSVDKSSEDAFNPEREFMDREEISEHQDRKLREQVEYAVENTEYYQNTFAEEDIDPSDIKTRNDYQRLVPTMLKDDLRDARDEDSPYGGFLAIDESEIDYIHTSTGTTGIPTYMPVTKKEVRDAANITGRLLHQAGIGKGDTVLSPGIYYHLYSRISGVAIEDIMGATQFNRGGFPFELESDIEEALPLWTMQNPDYISGMAIRITNLLQENNIDPKEAFPDLKGIKGAGQIITPDAREEIEEFWDAPLYESGGPTDQLAGLSMLCDARKEGWGHFFEDAGFYEILDFETGEPVAEGERGEHTYTSFILSSTPYLRWRSEDAGIHGGYDCECGRCHLRSKILGRTGQMIQVQDRTIFPRDFERIRDRYGYGTWPYQFVRQPDQPQDTLEIRFSAPIEDQERNAIADDLEGILEVPVEIEYIDEDDIPRKGGWKPKIIHEAE